MSAEVLRFPEAQTPAPSNIEMETALLGGMLLDNRRIDQAADILAPHDFADPWLGALFGLVLTEYGKGKPVNSVSLRSMVEPDKVAILAAMQANPSVLIMPARDMAKELVELSHRRALMTSLSQAAVDLAGHRGLDEVAGEVETALLDSSGTRDGMVELSGSECIRKALGSYENHDHGVSSGLQPVDEAMGPIRRKALAIVAARPGMGKSALAVSYALGAAHKGHGVLIVSLEMSAEDIGERMACDMCFDANVQVPYGKLINGSLSRDELGSLMAAQEQIAELPITILDTTALSVGKLSAIVRRWKRRYASRGQSLDLVIVDYLQLLRAPGSNGRYEQITEISQTLKEIAKANDLGVMALSQLSRNVEQRPDKRPQLSDLRESGQIEQDADAVLFLLRKEYYLTKAEPGPYDPERMAWEAALAECQGKIEFICAKRRKGQEGTTVGRFYGAYQAVRA